MGRGEKEVKGEGKGREKRERIGKGPENAGEQEKEQ